MIFGKKDKSGKTAINIALNEGIPNWMGGSSVRLVLDSANSQLCIESRTNKKYPPALLKYSQLTAADVVTEQEIKTKSKNVVGRAAIGGLLLGSLGATIGGMSGIGEKQQTCEKQYLIINYTSSVGDEPKVLSFEVVGATLHLDDFMKMLKSKLPAPNPELAAQYL
jgi:hypothetical protein